jgi:putative copper export protein
MAPLTFIHVLCMAIWFGTVATEILLELLLWNSKTSSEQKAFIDLHRRIDLAIELPSILGVIISGVLLMSRHGYFHDTVKWPIWLEDKLIAAAFAIIANLLCMIFVVQRARNTDNLLGAVTPLSQSRIRIWHMAVSSTIIAAPFGAIALWFAISGHIVSP